MFKKIFRKVFLLAGIFLLATFMSVQLSWGCDDHDKWDRDHHDKWSCNHHGKPCHPPKIQIVYLDYPADSIEFTIWGENFDDGAPPVVTLGGRYKLNVDENDYSNTRIIATLPLQDLQGEFIYGDYRLVVSTCHDSACKDKYCKDHGSNCKCKYCRDHCSKCKDKYCKDKYCKDHEYKGRCKARYSLTIPGLPGGIGLKIESKKLELNSKEIMNRIEVNVVCGSGFGVTGGGFSCPKCLECPDCVRIMVSEPLQDEKTNGIGWHVIATYMVPTQIAPIELTVHAICTQVQ